MTNPTRKEPLSLPARTPLEKDLLREIQAMRRALVYYANRSNWGEDGWGIKAVHKAEYADAGQRARKAIKRVDEALNVRTAPRLLP